MCSKENLGVTLPPSMSVTFISGHRLALSTRRWLPRWRMTSRACPPGATFTRISPRPRSRHWPCGQIPQA